MATPSPFQTLPVELKRSIWSHVMNAKPDSGSKTLDVTSPQNLPGLAALCRGWQPIVEESTFRNITLTPPDIDMARQMLTPLRRAAIQTLSLKYFVPWDIMRLPLNPQAPEPERCFWIFMLQSFTLFSGTHVPMKHNVLLSIDIIAPPKLQGGSAENNRGGGSSHKCYDRQLTADLEQLPQLDFVSQLEIDSPKLGTWGSQPRILRIATRLPRLSGVRFKVLDYSANFQERFRLRQEMAESINMLSGGLTVFICSIAQGVAACHNSPGSPKPSSADDPLTKAFYKVSRFPQLRVFFLEAMMHETIFGPLDDISRPRVAYPKMRHYTVRLLGDIYPPVPIPPRLEELGVLPDDYPMTLAALAARQMPILKTMTCITMFGTVAEYNRKKKTLFNKYFRGRFRMSRDDWNFWQKTCQAHHPGPYVRLHIDGFQDRMSLYTPLVLPGSF